MGKLFLIALLGSPFLFPAAAAAQSVTLGETLCTADSIANAPSSDNLREGSHTVTVSWTASSSTLWYSVYRGTVNGGPYTLLASCIAGTSYVDLVAPSRIFYYVVQAVNASGASGNSNQPTAMIPLFDTLGGAAVNVPIRLKNGVGLRNGVGVR